MPVLSKETHALYIDKLTRRFDELIEVIKCRELTYPGEGLSERDAEWLDWRDMCATVGAPMDIRLAVEDFKGILGEIKKLK